MIPIVLHHGLFGFGRLRLGPLSVCSFSRIDRAIAGRGHSLIVSGVHPAASIARRAGQLKELILREIQKLPEENQRVVIVAHSLGGLDARYMISRLGMEKHVAALLTVSTPHRGSPYADWVMRNVNWRGKAMNLAKRMGLDLGAIPDLMTESCARFNEETADHPAVKYFSVSAARPRGKMPAWAIHSHSVIEELEGANDGLVSVQSATYGRHLETWEADHWQTINRRFLWLMFNPGKDVSPKYLEALEQVLATS